MALMFTFGAICVSDNHIFMLKSRISSCASAYHLMSTFGVIPSDPQGLQKTTECDRKTTPGVFADITKKLGV